MTQTAQAQILSVRDVDPALWKQLRVLALERDQKVGELLNRILREWLDTHR
jgi:hypothetical protein